MPETVKVVPKLMHVILFLHGPDVSPCAPKSLLTFLSLCDFRILIVLIWLLQMSFGIQSCP